MGVADTKRDLAANKMIYDVRRDASLYQNFTENFESIMEDYGLSEAERQAFRDRDIKRLSELGVHPYFLPQISRLFHGGTYNHNKSVAAQAYGESMVKTRGNPH